MAVGWPFIFCFAGWLLLVAAPPHVSQALWRLPEMDLTRASSSPGCAIVAIRLSLLTASFAAGGISDSSSGQRLCALWPTTGAGASTSCSRLLLARLEGSAFAGPRAVQSGAHRCGGRRRRGSPVDIIVLAAVGLAGVSVCASASSGGQLRHWPWPSGRIDHGPGSGPARVCVGL